MYVLDAGVTQWINGWAGFVPAIDRLWMWISAAGVPLLIVAVAGQWWLRQDRRHTRHILVSAGLSFVLGLALNQVILLFIHRVRPYDAGITRLLVERSNDPSFPSDHATAAFAIAAAFLFHDLPRRGIALLIGAVLVTFSRVYVGTHYLSDVVAGAMTGIIAAATVAAMYREGTRIDRFLTKLL